MKFRDGKWRRQLLMIFSGVLIAAALTIEHLLGWDVPARWLYTFAALAAGWDIAQRAIFSLRQKHVSIELLVTIAAAGALFIGEAWEAAAVTFLFVFGAYLEARTLSRTRQVLRSLLDLAPLTALILRDGQATEVSPNRVIPGETVLIKPGAKIAVDGEVIEGRAAVDESAITGEPIPAEKAPGSMVYAGTINGAALLKVRATGVGADTTLARIIRRVEEAQEEKAPTQRFIERFARWYTPAIIVLSSGVYLFSRDLELALTLLVIACPGALVISTPVSVIAGIGRAAQRGILIKGGEYLENAGKISALALDKTGTLTRGKPKVTAVISLVPVALPAPEMAGASDLVDTPWVEPDERWSANQKALLFWASVAENGSEHPLARAITAEVDAPQADSFETVTGRGVRAEYAGREILLGSPDMLGEAGVSLAEPARAALEELQRAGSTAVLVALDGEVAGIIGVSDPLRENARQAVERFQGSGLRRVLMLTGDQRPAAEAIAHVAGIKEVQAGLLPDDKLAAVRRLQQEGHIVAMVGDGINDAPALAAADIGIAMGAAGSGVAIETADIALMADDLDKIGEAIQLSKATLRNIHQNVFIALATVSLLIAGVLLGEVHMAGGMLVHEASVLIVIVNGMRLLKSK